MSEDLYLMDTHALIFWHNKVTVSPEFLHFFDDQARQGNLFVSAISFWEMALLVQKGRIAINDVSIWKNNLLQHTGIRLINVMADEMIASTLLPTYHNDPFDRVLIAQAQQNNLILVTRDAAIQAYNVSRFWIN